MTRMRIFKLIIWMLLSAIAAPSGAEVTRNVIYGHAADGMALPLDIYQPDQGATDAAIVLVVSGGFRSGPENTQRLERFILPLVDSGFTVFAVRHGNIGDYPVPAIFSHVSTAFEFIAENAESYSVDPQRLGVFGASSGGLLGAYLAFSDKTTEGETRKIRAATAVIFAGPSELRGDAFPELSPINLISRDDPPTLFIHGDSDEVVLISHSEQMHAALRAIQVDTEFVVIANGSHTGPWDSEDEARIMVSAMQRWFVQHLSKR